MNNIYTNSIFDNLDKKENLVSKYNCKLKEKYNLGYSSSSYWLSFDEDDLFDTDQKKKSELTYALVQICRSVNIIRHKLGIGENRSLKVKWASDKNHINSNLDDYIYLSSSPFFLRSKLTLYQKYDVVVGQAFLLSVQKHIIPHRLLNFIHRLKNMLLADIDFQITIIFDDGKIFFKNKDIFFLYQSELNSQKGKCYYEEKDYLEFKGNNDFYSYSNLSLKNFVEYINIWRIIEQDICEKAISNEYSGSLGYLHAHREYFTDKKFNSLLKEIVLYYDLEWMSKVWHLLIINNFNNQKITNVHPVYKKIMELADQILITDYKESSERRFASVVLLICKVSEFMEELKFKTIGLESEKNNLRISKQKKIDKFLDDVYKNKKIGLGDAIAAPDNICNKPSHKKVTDSIPPLEIGNEQMLKNLEMKFFSQVMSEVDFKEKIRYNKAIVSSKYSRIVNENIKFIEYLKENLKMRSYNIFSNEYSMKNGNLDEYNLWKLSLNNEESENIFYQKFFSEKAENIYLTIVFDNSGSMASGALKKTRIEICNDIAVVLREVISNCKNSRLDVFSFSGLNFYKFESDLETVCFQKAEGNTNEGFAITKAACHIQNFTQSNQEVHYTKYLIVVGDGNVNQIQVKNALKLIENNTDIKFFHIGIDNCYSYQYGEYLYGKDNFAIIPSKNLMQYLCMAVLKILI